jgi:hypothetical protein
MRFLCILHSSAIKHQECCKLSISIDKKQWDNEQSKNIIAALSKVIGELQLINYDKLIIDDDMCDKLINVKMIDVIDSYIGCDDEEVKTVKNKLPNVEIRRVINGMAE